GIGPFGINEHQGHATYCEQAETAAENEWIGEIGCRAPQADAAVRSMLKQQFLVQEIAVDLEVLRTIKHFHFGTRKQITQRRRHDEHPIAVARKALRFENRPDVRIW